MTKHLDIHGFSVNEARAYINSELKKCPKIITEIEIIHGYNQGNSLLKLVRGFKNPKIERIILGLNNGSTTFILKK